MADTHANAFAAEVDAKRREAANLLAEADALQTQWEEMTGEKWPEPEKVEAEVEPKPDKKPKGKAK